jgi:hypothetical protein
VTASLAVRLLGPVVPYLVLGLVATPLGWAITIPILWFASLRARAEVEGPE